MCKQIQISKGGLLLSYFRRILFILVLLAGLNSQVSAFQGISMLNQNAQKEFNNSAQYIQVIEEVGGYSVSIQVEEMDLFDALKILTNQMNVGLSWAADLDFEKPVSFKASQIEFYDLLDTLLKESDLEYRVSHDRNVLVIREKGDNFDEEHKMQRTVTGKVTDSQNSEALPGVNVIVAGSEEETGSIIGTQTDIDGNYSINVPEDLNTLVFTYIGYQRLELDINGSAELDVQLEQDIQTLDDVVVVAFGEQRREEVVGSVSTIDPAQMRIPSSDLTTALAGRMAGVIAYQRSGEPGQDNVEFFIRGVTTFGYKTDPLILIDGLELTSTDLARLQPDDIASFSIMKDAASTALYGARGANGVIAVTTKRGVEGRAQVSVRLENSISSPTRDVKLADPLTHMRLHNEAVATRDPLGILPYSRSKIDNTVAELNTYAYPATDWQEMLFKDYALNHRGNFSVSGGGQTAQYYLSGSFSQDSGILNVDDRNNFNNNIDLKTYLIRSNIDINLTETTRVGINMYGSFDQYSGPIDGGEGMYRKVMRSNPVLFPAYYPPGEQLQHIPHILFGNYDQGNYLNPYAEMVKGYRESTRSLMLAQIELRQELSMITEGLGLRMMANTSRLSSFDISRFYNPFYYSLGFYDRFNDTYTISILNQDSGTEYLGYDEGEKHIMSNFYLESHLDYNRTFRNIHGVSGLLVFLMRNEVVANAGDLQQSLPFRNLGLSGRATYNYDLRYFAEFNFGYNGSERFYETERFGFFPSFGVSWYISNEEFWRPMRRVVSDLKLRATYGLVGNDEIGGPQDRFFYLSNVNMNDEGRGAVFGTNNVYHRNGVSISRYDNRNITWEQARQINIGLELGLYERLSVTADIYHEHRSNILMTRAHVPTTMGLSAPLRANLGEATGQGIDLSVDHNTSFGNTAWLALTGNFTYASSAYKAFEEPQYEHEVWLSRIGQPLSQQWGYIAERLFVDEDEVANSPTQHFGDYMAGDIKYRDVNGDGEITTLDMVPIGYPSTPEIVYGFGFSSGYKNFDLSAFFQGVARTSFWIDTNATAPFIDYRYSDGELDGIELQNALLQAYAEDHWSEDNRNIFALWPRLDASNNSANNTQPSTWFMRDGSFLRLKNVELGYTLPVQLQSSLNLTNARVYVNGVNLLTFSRFNMWDVEMGGNGLNYPIQRVINVGVQFSF